MKRSISLAPLLLLAGAIVLSAAPRVTSVEPALAAPGDQLVASGEDLTSIEGLYLTVGTTDVPVEVIEKTAESIQFRVPADVEMGQYHLMIETGGDSPALLVQPVMCEVATPAEVAERRAQEERARQRTQEDAAAAAQPQDGGR